MSIFGDLETSLVEMCNCAKYFVTSLVLQAPPEQMNLMIDSALKEFSNELCQNLLKDVSSEDVSKLSTAHCILIGIVLILYLRNFGPSFWAYVCGINKPDTSDVNTYFRLYRMFCSSAPYFSLFLFFE